MINILLSWVGKIFAGPVIDLASDYIKSQTDRDRIRADIEMTNITASTEESIETVNASTEQLTRRPLIMVIAQSVLWGISLFYFAALVVASVWPASGLVVAALPGLWEFLVLAVLAGLAGPYVLNLLKSRLGGKK